MSQACDAPRHWETRFQEAALESSRWLLVLAELADATGSSRGELIGISAGTSLFNWISGLDAAMVRDFAVPEAHRPDVNYRVAAEAGTEPLSIVDEADYDRVRPGLACELYVELCERHHFPFGCQTTLARSRDGLIGLALHRSRRDGRTSDEARSIFSRAAPAALAGVRLQRAIEDQGLQLLAGTLDAMAAPCLLLDGHGVVRAVTGAAEALLRNFPGLRMRDGRLASALAADDRLIQLALREVIGETGRPTIRLALTPRKPGALLVLEMVRLPRQPWSMSFAPRALVRLRAGAAAPTARADEIAQLLPLTRAEAEIAVALCRGQSREEIARARGVTHETIRAQLKSLYAKTGCNRETQLLLLLRPLLD